MAEIGKKPVLERIANYLEKQGVDRIIVNLHKDPEMIMKYFGQRFLYLYEPVPMGEFATVSLVKSWFPNEEIIVVNGDTLIEFDLFNFGKIKHSGITIYSKDGKKDRIYNDNFIDIGTESGLIKARKKYDRN